jgi:hypothetical protein
MNDWKEKFEYRMSSAWENYKELIWLLPFAIIVAVAISGTIVFEWLANLKP